MLSSPVLVQEYPIYFLLDYPLGFLRTNLMCSLVVVLSRQKLNIRPILIFYEFLLLFLTHAKNIAKNMTSYFLLRDSLS